MSFTVVVQLKYCYENDNWNSFKNRSKWALAEMDLRRFSTAFRTALLRTRIGGCKQSVCEATVSRIFHKYLGKKT